MPSKKATFNHPGKLEYNGMLECWNAGIMEQCEEIME
jgi:hypothetical protein